MQFFPEFSILIAYLGACLLLVASPGPDMMIIINNTIGRGFIAGVMTAFGVFLGVFIQAPVISLGTATILVTYENAFIVLQALGAAYLGYLSYKNFRQFFTENGATVFYSGTKAYTNSIFEGFLTNVTNPKVLLFLFAFIPQFVTPEKGNTELQLLVLVILLKVNGFCFYLGVVYFSGHIKNRLLTGESRKNWSALFSGLVFLCISGLFFIKLLMK